MSEYVGILYLLVILSQSEEAWFIIESALQKGQCGSMSDVLYIFEMILCFDAWINQTSFWTKNQNIEYIGLCTQSIKSLMREIKNYLPLTMREQGWKNPKFHFLLHFVEMITCFGAPKNYDSQCPEFNHKYFAKQPGRRSKKTNKGSDFEHQVATRVCESMIIDELNDSIDTNISKNVNQQMLTENNEENIMIILL